MKVQTSAPSRAGLAGNPSDGYGGRAVAVAITGFEAHATIEPAAGAHISSALEGRLSFRSPQSLLEHGAVAPGSPHRLAIACCRRFYATAMEQGRLEGSLAGDEGFDLRYRSDIPQRVGLAGSSALAVSILRALAVFHDVSILDEDLPSLALAVETGEMGIHGGLMDRVSQVLGGVAYMDLSEAVIAGTGRGDYEALPEDRLPDLFIAWRPDLASGSEVIHNSLRERVRRGEAGAMSLLADLAALADEARRVLLSDSPDELAAIMDANFELRARLVDVSSGNRLLVETGRRFGAGVKQAGSGGAVVGAHDGDPARLEKLKRAYDRIGARFLVPGVWMGPTAGSTLADADRPSLPHSLNQETGETGVA
jgi:glucuronokinase